MNDFIDSLRVPLNRASKRAQRAFEEEINSASRTGQTGNTIRRVLDRLREEFETSVSAALATLKRVAETTSLDPSDLRQMTAQELENFALAIKSIVQPDRLRAGAPQKAVIDSELRELDNHLQFMLRQFDVGLLDFEPLQGVAAKGTAGNIGNPPFGPTGVSAGAKSEPELPRAALGLGSTPPHSVTLSAQDNAPTYPVVSDSAGALEINSLIDTSPGSSRSRPSNRTAAQTAIGTAVLQNGSSIELVAVSFLSFIEDKLSSLLLARANSDEAVQEIADYEDLKRRVGAFLAATEQFLADQTKEVAIVESTTSLAGGLRNWWTKKHGQICDKAFDMGLFTLGVSVCLLAGSGGALAAIVPGVLVGGKPVVDALRSWSKTNEK